MIMTDLDKKMLEMKSIMNKLYNTIKALPKIQQDDIYLKSYIDGLPKCIDTIDKYFMCVRNKDDVILSAFIYAEDSIIKFIERLIYLIEERKDYKNDIELCLLQIDMTKYMPEILEFLLKESE